MEFPIEIQRLINEFAKPITRPDWREGSSIKRTMSPFDDGATQYYRFKNSLTAASGSILTFFLHLIMVCGTYLFCTYLNTLSISIMYRYQLIHDAFILIFQLSLPLVLFALSLK